MIDYVLGTYAIEDSLNVPHFRQRPTIVELKFEAEQLNDVEVEQTETQEEAEEREMLLRKLGSRPTSCPKAIGASDFAGMLQDLHAANTPKAKAEVLTIWSDFFYDEMKDILVELAEATLKGDVNTARSLIARICA